MPLAHTLAFDFQLPFQSTLPFGIGQTLALHLAVVIVLDLALTFL
ncbi:MAG: hypothetical protein R3E21_05005 [Caenibius sp.]